MSTCLVRGAEAELQLGLHSEVAHVERDCLRHC